MNNLQKRIIADCAILTSLFFLPWWCTLVASILGVFYFDFYSEAILGGLLLDVLYGIHTSSFISTFPLTLILSSVCMISFWLKHRFIFLRA